MPNPNMYECKACGAKFDTKEQLDVHNRREHSSGATAGAGADSKSGSSTPSEKKIM